MERIRILAVSGSLRAVSSNTILLHAASRLGVEILYQPIGLLNAESSWLTVPF